MRDRLPTEPSLFGLLQQTDTSYCLLEDYMSPGIHVAGQEDDLGRFRAAFTELDTNNTGRPSNKYAGRIFLERLGPNSLLQLRFGTQEVPSMSAGLHVWPGCAVFGHLTTTGQSWAGALMDQTFRVPTVSSDTDESDGTPRSRNVNLKLGTWLDGRVQFIEKTPFKDSVYVQADQLNGYAAVNLLGALCAVEANVPLNTLDLTTRSYMSMDVGSTSALPLRLAMERSQNTSTISLSQLLSFDRYQFNPMEDRAPRVLNRLGWTIRMDHHHHHHDHHGDEGGSTSVALGGAWQINRAVAVKAVMRPTDADRFLTTACILKRWQQPRVTASFLFRHSLHTPLWSTPPRFLGVGLEIETGNLQREEQFFQEENHVGGTNSANQVPTTKVVFEDDI